jgi:hypothetical protein
MVFKIFFLDNRPEVVWKYKENLGHLDSHSTEIWTRFLQNNYKLSRSMNQVGNQWREYWLSYTTTVNYVFHAILANCIEVKGSNIGRGGIIHTRLIIHLEIIL